MSGLTVNERQELISALIGNCSGWGEDDAEYLAGLEDGKLTGHAEHCFEAKVMREKLANNAAPSLEEVDDEALFAEIERRGWVEEEPADEPVDNSQPMTDEQYLAQLPPRMRSVVTNALNFEATQKAQLVERITANAKNRFAPEWLNQLEIEELQGMLEMIDEDENQPNFLGAAGGPVANGEDLEEPMGVPVLNFERTKASA